MRSFDTPGIIAPHISSIIPDTFHFCPIGTVVCTFLAIFIHQRIFLAVRMVVLIATACCNRQFGHHLDIQDSGWNICSFHNLNLFSLQ